MICYDIMKERGNENQKERTAEIESKKYRQTPNGKSVRGFYLQDSEQAATVKQRFPKSQDNIFMKKDRKIHQREEKLTSQEADSCRNLIVAEQQ